MILVIISLFTDGTRYISEEFLFRKYYIHTYEMVGMEGCWGLLMYVAVMMPLLCFLPCKLLYDACVY